MATPAQRTNTWTLDEWYDQAVAGTQGAYNAVDPGTVYTWGRDVAPSSRHGVLGHNCQPNPSHNYLSSPVQIPGTTWTNIAFLGSTAIATKSDNTLWMWGYNNNGVLGQNHPDNSMSSPTQVGTNTTWSGKEKRIAGSTNQTYQIAGAIKTDGTLWSWGRGDNGALAHNNQTDYSSPRQVGTNTTWDKLAMSLEHGASIKTDGTLWAWGHNEQGALGQDNVVAQSSPVQIPGTWSDVHVYSNNYGQCNMQGLKTDGSMWMWGMNEFGSLGQNEAHDSHKSSPVQIPGTWASLPRTSGWSQAQSIHAAINTDDELWVWGGNDTGALGLNSPSQRSSPAQLPGSWSNVSVYITGGAAVRTNGTLWAWGHNSYGTLGQNTTTNSSSPKQVGTDTDWTFVSSGQYNISAFKVS